MPDQDVPLWHKPELPRCAYARVQACFQALARRHHQGSSPEVKTVQEL